MERRSENGKIYENNGVKKNPFQPSRNYEFFAFVNEFLDIDHNVPILFVFLRI